MKVSPKRLTKRLHKYEVPVDFVKGWDTDRVDPYNGSSNFKGILLHHTAGTNSLNYICFGTRYAPVRACHFLVGRDGTVFVVAKGAYHAGTGGPYTFKRPSGRTTTVAKNKGNQGLWGIEIESLGRSARIDGTAGGMTTDQVVSTAMLCVALMDASRAGLASWPVNRVIRHKDWAPRRKIDTKQSLAWWQQAVQVAYDNRKDPSLAKRRVQDWVKENRKGRL